MVSSGVGNVHKADVWPLEHDRRFNHPLAVLLAILLGGVSVARGVDRALMFDVVLGLVLVVLFAPALMLILLEQHRDRRFRRWVLAHATEIRAGTAVFEGVRVSLDTDFVAYRVIISLVAFGMTETSRFVLPGTPTEVVTRRRSTIITAICGWWLPFSGPSRTLEAIGLNRSAGPGVVMPLGLILERLEKGWPLGRDAVEA